MLLDLYFREFENRRKAGEDAACEGTRIFEESLQRKSKTSQSNTTARLKE